MHGSGPWIPAAAGHGARARTRQAYQSPMTLSAAPAMLTPARPGRLQQVVQQVGAEHLALDMRHRHTRAEQRVTLRLHEAERPAQVEAAVDEALQVGLTQHVGQRHGAGVVVIAACGVAGLREFVADVRDQSRHALARPLQVGAMGMVVAVARGVGEQHGPLRALRGQRAQHRQHRRDADPARQQHQRAAALQRGGELAERRAHPELGALVGVGVQPVGHRPGRRGLVAVLALDRDAPGRQSGLGRQRVLAQLARAMVQARLDADVLARAEFAQRLAVGRGQRQCHHLGALRLAAHHAHRHQFAGGHAGALVQARLGGDEFSGEQPVGLVPGRQQRRRGGFAQHRRDRAEQVAADDRIVRRRDAHGRMLVHDAFDHRPKRRRVVDVGGVGEHRRRQRLLLAAVGLVAHVEQLGQFGPVGEHLAVEMRGDGQAVLAQHGHACIDIGAGSGGQHQVSLRFIHAENMHVFGQQKTGIRRPRADSVRSGRTPVQEITMQADDRFGGVAAADIGQRDVVERAVEGLLGHVQRALQVAVAVQRARRVVAVDHRPVPFQLAQDGADGEALGAGAQLQAAMAAARGADPAQLRQTRGHLDQVVVRDAKLLAHLGDRDRPAAVATGDVHQQAQRIVGEAGQLHRGAMLKKDASRMQVISGAGVLRFGVAKRVWRIL
ncbi:hypothetical protein CT19431_240317 [Cupriavidus taiwanensis]|nr:hypothetical protein CT19431_240317 [Cupriavidus taiwanensis]